MQVGELVGGGHLELIVFQRRQQHRAVLDAVGEVHLGARPWSEVDRLALRHQHCLVDVHLPLGATAASTAGKMFLHGRDEPRPSARPRSTTLWKVTPFTSTPRSFTYHLCRHHLHWKLMLGAHLDKLCSLPT